MNLRNTLSPDTILLNLKSDRKEGVIAEMADALMKAGKIRDLNARTLALKAVMDREKKMSTGMQNGIAIPHGKTDAVDTLIAALGIKREGIDFGSLDGKPTHILVMTISPNTRTGPHIQFLAEISRILNDEGNQKRLLEAGTPEEILDILAP